MPRTRGRYDHRNGSTTCGRSCQLINCRVAFNFTQHARQVPWRHSKGVSGDDVGTSSQVV